MIIKFQKLIQSGSGRSYQYSIQLLISLIYYLIIVLASKNLISEGDLEMIVNRTSEDLENNKRAL